MSIKNQREQLMRTAIGQVTTIIFILIGTWLYSIPLYKTLSASIVSSNAAIKQYSETVNDGITYENLNTLLKAKWQEELLGIIQSAPQDTKKVIKKVGTDPYLTWLRQAIDSNTSKDEKINLEIKKARLNSILPTLSPLSNNITEDTVSMKKYITYVEENIIKKYNLETTASLSLQNITYGKKWSGMPDIIGSFDNEISFKATNNNIIKMINYVNQLGRPDLLLNTGSENTEWIPEIMSNPLALIDSFSLENSLDLTKLNEKNSGRMTLRFYVRGSSLTDIAYLRTAVTARNVTLGKNIELKLAACTKDVTCPNITTLQVLSKKYKEFNNSIAGNKKVSQGTELMYALSAELDSVIALEEELKNLI